MIAETTEGPSMPNCIVVVQFDLPKRSEEQAVKGGTSTAPTYRGLAKKGLIRKDYLNGENGTGGVYLWDSRESARQLRCGSAAGASRPDRHRQAGRPGRS
jgi:hypothetical protein